MSAADLVFKNFTLSADGHGFAGNISEFQPPNLTIKEEDFRAGGMDAPVKVDLGMEALTASFTLTKFSLDAFRLWGILDTSGAQFTARGAAQSLNGAVEPVIVRMTGNLRNIEPGAWKAGEKIENKFTISLIAYQWTQNGRVVHDIDILNMRRVINGVDQLTLQRTALGL